MYSGILPETANGIRETALYLKDTADVTFNADGTYSVSNTAPNTKNVTAQAWSRNHKNGPTAFQFRCNIYQASGVVLRLRFSTWRS